MTFRLRAAHISDLEHLYEMAKLTGGGFTNLPADRQALEAKLGEADSAKLAWKPTTTVEVDESNAGTLMKLVDTLEDDDDVQTVWGNYEVSDEVMEKLG